MPQTGEQLRQRYASDTVYREKRKALAREYNRSHKAELRVRRAARYEGDAAVREAAWDRAYQHRHGITQDQKDQMILEQGSKCAACECDLRQLPRRHRHVDHSHMTKKVRGVLCHNCNVALGHVRDSTQRLKMLIDYLHRTE